MTRAHLIDITCQLHRETEKAIFVSDDGDAKKAVWLPRSQIEIEQKGNGIVELTMPEWLATEKGLV